VEWPLSEIVGAAAAGVNEEWRRDAMVCVTACQVNEKERVDDDSGAQLMKNRLSLKIPPIEYQSVSDP